MKPPPIIGNEHAEIDFGNFGDEYRKWLNAQKTKYQNKETLGLHPKGDSFAPGNFIGMVWIGEGENKAVLRVDSKFPTMNYIKMFAECVADPFIGKHINCLHFWAKQDLIDVENDNDFLLLTAIAFLHELNTLCKRHLRRHFLREQQNFVGKVKGKILIGKNLQQNIIRQRPDRIFCEYQSVGNDILENRILRTALEKAARCIAKHKNNNNENYLSKQQEWIRACRAHLNGVSIVHIKQRDFVAVRTRGVFAHYKRPLNLAKAVLQQFGFNPKQDIKQQTQTPPFALNSAELFERYAELQLREKYQHSKVLRKRKIKSDEDKGNYFSVLVCPDFYIAREGEQQPQIIDAKYKRIEDDKPDEKDMYQVVAYSQHKKLLDEMGCANNQEIELSLVYPFLYNDKFNTKPKIKKWKTTTAFSSELHIYKIHCPTKSNADQDD